MELSDCGDAVQCEVAIARQRFRRCGVWALLKLALIATLCWLAALRITAAAPPYDAAGEVYVADDDSAEIDEADNDLVARLARMQPQLEPLPASPPRTGGASSTPRAPSPLSLGSSLRRLGGPRGPQAAAPPVIGDRFGGGQSCFAIPVMIAPGTGFNTTVQAGTQSVPFFLTSGGANGPLRIVSPDEPPAFPSRAFFSVGNANTANQAFKAGNNIALQDNPQFNQDALNSLVAAYPAGTVLPTGQTAAGGGVATPLNTRAVLDTSNSPPQDGRDLDVEDLFFIRGNYLYVPDVFFGPQEPLVVCIDPASSGAAVLGTTKLAENCSPLPRDRVYFNYSMFDDTPLLAGGQNVHRFSPGFEKTFFDQLTSVEVRFPFAATISPDLALGTNGLTAADDVVFGNMAAIFKGLLYQSDIFAFSTGLQVSVPTAPSLNVSLTDGTQIISIDNQAVHLMPFVGALYTPNDRFFSQAFLQFDADASGNPVAVNPQLQGLTRIGRLHDATFLYADFNIGYWLYRGVETSLTGFAPTIELHYNTSLEHGEFLASDGFVIGASPRQISNLNLTMGCYFEFALDNTLVLGYTAPLGNGADRQFDGELRAFFNHRFGTSSRAARI
jgi:hypothetical protein